MADQESHQSVSQEPEIETTFAYPDLTGMEPLIITNSRKEAIRLIQKGFTTCLIPQMFGSDVGLYGLHPTESGRTLTEEQADQQLADDEWNVRKKTWKCKL